MGSVPPVDSMRISDQNTPVEICTDATFEIAMVSSLLPKKRDLIRLTRCGLTTSLVGKRKLPGVHRLAVKVSAGELSIGLSGLALGELIAIPARLFSRPRYSQRSGWPGRSAFQQNRIGRRP